MNTSPIRPRRAALATGAVALTLLLAACGGNGGGDDAPKAGSSADDVSAALEEGGSLTVWSWDPTLESAIKAFEKAYPDVDVELVNAGTGNDHYTALQNAIAAGDGVPDVAQVEYYAVPQFALADSLAELGQFGASELDGTFSPGPWESVHFGDGIYGMPVDSGPMAMFYNKSVFDKHGVDVPTTWEEYLEAAEALHDADPDLYIANDAGDPGFTESMIWQAGGQPFNTDGETVSIDLADEGSTKFAEMWQQLLDDELLAPIPTWSEEWYKALAGDQIATLTTGGWMPANLESGVPEGKGDWAVAQMPQWAEGETATAENGGSSMGIPAASENQALAYGFLEFVTAGEGVQPRLDEGAFPARLADLNSEAFLGQEFSYFGGQKVNEVLSQSAASVVSGWSYLPYQVYANSVFADTVGQAYQGGTSLADALADWQQTLTAYGEEQGFTLE